MEKEIVEITAKAVDFLPQVAGQLAAYNPSGAETGKDPGMVNLIEKARKYINFLLDEGIESFGVEIKPKK